MLKAEDSSAVGSTIEHPRWAPVAGVQLLPLSFGIMSGAAAHSNNDHQSKKRAVVVYARAGQAHLAAAQTLRRILEGDPNIEVLLRDGKTTQQGAARGRQLRRLRTARAGRHVERTSSARKASGAHWSRSSALRSSSNAIRVF